MERLTGVSEKVCSRLVGSFAGVSSLFQIFVTVINGINLQSVSDSPKRKVCDHFRETKTDLKEITFKLQFSAVTRQLFEAVFVCPKCMLLFHVFVTPGMITVNAQGVFQFSFQTPTY